MEFKISVYNRTPQEARSMVNRLIDFYKQYTVDDLDKPRIYANKETIDFLTDNIEFILDKDTKGSKLSGLLGTYVGTPIIEDGRLIYGEISISIYREIMSADDFRKITSCQIADIRPGDFIFFSMSPKALDWGVDVIIQYFNRIKDFIPEEVGIGILPDLTLYEHFGKEYVKEYIKQAINNYEEFFGEKFYESSN